MKTKLVLGFAAVLAAVAVTAARAQTVYWDTNGATSGFASPTTAGTWITGGSANNFWTADSTGVAAGAAWADNESAVFYSPTAPGVANTVATSGTINVAGITLQNGRWAFSGTSAINLGSGGLNYSVPLGGSAGGGSTFASGESFVLTASQSWLNNANIASNNWTINGSVTGAAGASVVLTLGGSVTGTGVAGGSGFTFSGVLANGASGGSLGLTLDSANVGSVFQLSGANTYTGATSILAGVLQVSTLSTSTTAGSGLGEGTGTIALGGSSTYTGTIGELNFVGSAAGALTRAFTVGGIGGEIANNSSAVTSTLTLGGSVTSAASGVFRTFTLGGSNTGANVLGGVLADNADFTQLALVKADAGHWIINGANTYSGGTTITGGTLEVGASGTLGFNSNINNITIQGGNLLLDAASNIGSAQSITITNLGGGIGFAYDPTSLPTLSDNSGTAGGVFGINYSGMGGITGPNAIAAISNLFGSSSYWFLGSFVGGSGTYTGTSLPVGALNTYRLGGGGGALTVQNAILVDSGGSNALFGSTGGGTVNLSGGNTYAGTTTIQNGTVGVSSLKSVGGGASSLGAPTTVANGTITLGSGSNAVGINYTGTGDSTDRVLNFATGATGTVTFSNSGTGAINYTSAPTFGTSGARTLAFGVATDAQGGSIGKVADSGTGKTTVTKNGLTNSTWALTGTGANTNTHTGNTTISGGVLQTVTGADLAGSYVVMAGNLTSGVSDQAIWQASGTISRTLSGTAAATNMTWGNYSGFAAKGGTLTVNLNGGAPLVWGVGSFAGSGTSPISFGSTTADSQVILQNGVDFGAASNGFDRAIDVEGGAAAIVGGTSNNGISGSSTLLSGAITALNGNGNNGFKKTGSGTLVLGNAANTYSGNTTITAGTLVLGGSTSSTASAQSTNNGAVSIGATQITLTNATGVTVGEFVVGAGIASGTTVTAVNGNVITLSTGTTAAIASGTGGDNLTFGQAGVTGLSTAAITLGSANVNGNDGTTINNASPTLLIGGAYTVFNPITIGNFATTGTYGIGGSTDNSATFFGTITANQSFTVTQAATTGGNALTLGAITGAQATAKTVTFNNAGAVIDAGVIGGGTGTLGVVKSNGGVLTLQGANTYAGGTTLSGGLTRAGGGGNAFGSGALTINGGAQISAIGTAAYTVTNATTFSGNVVLGDKVNTGVLTFGTPTVAASTTLTVLSNVNFSSLNLPSTTTLNFDLTNSPLLTLTGTFTASTLAFDFTNFNVGQLYSLVSFAGGSGLSAGNFSLTGDLGGYTAAWSLTGTGLGVTLTSAVPEPSTWALLGAGAAALFLGFRRRRAA